MGVDIVLYKQPLIITLHAAYKKLKGTWISCGAFLISNNNVWPGTKKVVHYK
jgi:hypothetical protein